MRVGIVLDLAVYFCGLISCPFEIKVLIVSENLNLKPSGDISKVPMQIFQWRRNLEQTCRRKPVIWSLEKNFMKHCTPNASEALKENWPISHGYWHLRIEKELQVEFWIEYFRNIFISFQKNFYICTRGIYGKKIGLFLKELFQ